MTTFIVQETQFCPWTWRIFCKLPSHYHCHHHHHHDLSSSYHIIIIIPTPHTIYLNFYAHLSLHLIQPARTSYIKPFSIHVIFPRSSLLTMNNKTLCAHHIIYNLAFHLNHPAHKQILYHPLLFKFSCFSLLATNQNNLSSENVVCNLTFHLICPVDKHIIYQTFYCSHYISTFQFAEK